MDSGLRTIANSANTAKQGLSGVASGARGLGGAFRALTPLMKMTGAMFAGNLLAAGVTAAVTAVTALQEELMDTAAEYAGIKARLGLIAGSQQNVAALNDMIYNSAQRARGGYLDMAQAVSQLSLNAKDAFPDPREAVTFMEGLQKLFVVGGASKENQRNAMLQLTQAMASGRLQGDEFRSISENAPMIQNILAKSMGVSRGQLKQLASEGKITADVIKTAIIGNMAEINAQFEAVPKTWGDHFTDLKNVATRAFVPIYDNINGLANSAAVKSMISGVKTGIVFTVNAIRGIAGGARRLISGIGSGIGGAFTIAGQAAAGFFGFLSAAFPPAMALVAGLATAWAVYTAQALAAAAVQELIAAKTAVMNAILLVYNGAVRAVAAAKAIWAAITFSAAGAQLVLAMAMSLVTGNILLMAAIIAGVLVAAYLIWNSAGMTLADGIAGAMDFIIDATETAVNACIKLINGLITVLNAAAGGINSVFGTNIGKIGLVGEVNFQGAKQWSDAVRKGTFMEKVKTAAGDTFGDLFKLPDMSNSGNWPGGLGDQIAANTGDTAGNTKGIKDALDSSAEDLRFLKEAAEREAINKYTTATVHIDVGGLQVHNNERRDFDGMLRQLTDKVQEAVISGAEAVKA